MNSAGLGPYQLLNILVNQCRVPATVVAKGIGTSPEKVQSWANGQGKIPGWFQSNIYTFYERIDRFVEDDEGRTVDVVLSVDTTAET